MTGTSPRYDRVAIDEQRFGEDKREWLPGMTVCRRNRFHKVKLNARPGRDRIAGRSRSDRRSGQETEKKRSGSLPPEFHGREIPETRPINHKGSLALTAKVPRVTQSFTDPGEVVLTGQNPYMLLFSADGPPTSIVSFWRVHFSPVGVGHALYLRSELTGGAPKIYTDNTELARYIQRELYANNARPFGFFADPALAVTAATFVQSGDARNRITETVKSASDEIVLSWFDLLPAFKGGTAASLEEGRGHGHYALYFPSKSTLLSINGKAAAGMPKLSDRDGRANASAGLAWSETWVRPVAK